MTPGQLVKAVAIALDVPEETVTQHDRNLVVAGLRTKGGRGRSAPEVTLLDAARLLVATLAAVRTKDSVGIVRVFGKATLEPPWRYAEAFEYARVGDRTPSEVMKRFSDLDSLPNNHNFIDAIAALIADASVRMEVDLLKRRFGAVNISCYMPLATATIGRKNEINLFYRFLAGTEQDPVSSARNSKPEREPHEVYLRRYGIHQDREVYGNVIMLLGKAFRDGGLPYSSAQDALDALLGAKKPAAKKKAI